MFRLSQISTIGAFRYQLTPDGVLVAPLGIKGLTRSVALTRDESGVWRGHSAVNCGFMPIRGHGAVPERNIHVAEDLTVRFDDGQDVDVEALTQAIASPGEVVWTGVLIDRPLDLLDFYLAELEGFCRILAPPSIAERGLIEPANGWGSMGVAAGQALGHLTKRTSPDNPHLYELGVCAYGPGAAAMLHDLVERVDWWGRTRDSIAGVRIEVYPSGQGEVLDALMTVDKRHSRVVVRPEPEPGPKEPLASSDLDTEGQVRHAGVHRCVLEGKLAGVADPHGRSFGIPAGDLNRARVDVDALCLPTQLHRLVEDGTRATVGIEQGFARLAGQPYHRRCDGGPRTAPRRSEPRPSCWRIRTSDARSPAMIFPAWYSITHTSMSAGSAKRHCGCWRCTADETSRRRSVRRNDRSCITRAITRKVTRARTGRTIRARASRARSARCGRHKRLAIHCARSPSERSVRPTSTHTSSASRTASTLRRADASAVKVTTSDRPSKPASCTCTPDMAASSSATCEPRPGMAKANIRVASARAGCDLRRLRPASDRFRSSFRGRNSSIIGRFDPHLDAQLWVLDRR